MASTKTKSGLSDSTPSKTSPATPRVAKLSRGVAKPEPNSPSPIQNSRLSSDRSPHSANSKPSIERRSPRVPSPSEKTQPRVARGSESQTRLNQIQEDLKKANEQIASLEKEKAKALDELNEVRKDAEVATNKLNEALAAQKKAEEDSEIEKFQAVEAGIEAAHKKEEELKKELESVKNQHASDSEALLSVTQELEKVKLELAAANNAKSGALSQADDANKMAEIHAEKVEILSSELTRLKALLDSTREKEAISSNEMALKLKAEIGILKGELEKARRFEGEAKERETIIEQLKVDLEAAKMAESYSHSIAEEWKNEVKELEKQVEEAKNLERTVSVSLESAMKQLEENNDSLCNAESEIATLKERVGSLEITVERQKTNLEDFERHLSIAKEEISNMENGAEELRKEVEILKDEKNTALKNEQVAASNAQRLLEEKDKLASELESSKEEEEKSKKAMESLASALHEVSSEARELKEKLLSQADHEYETQIEDLKLVIKATNEKYEGMLDEARHEIDMLLSAVEQTNNHFESSKSDWEIKEANWVNHVKKLEEEVASTGREVNRLANLLKRTEEEANAAKKNETQMRDSLKEVEDEVIYLQETLREAKAESMKLKESLLDKETEFQSLVHENEELKAKEDVFQKKIEELSKSLEEASVKKQAEENGELSESEKDYDLLPKVVEFSEENGHRRREEKSKLETNDETHHQEELSSNGLTGEHINGKHRENHEEKEEKEANPDDDSVEVEFKMWESCQIEKKEAFPDRKSGQESPEEEEDSTKIDESDKNSTENVDETGNALTAEDQQMKKKKKKTLLGKVGNLLKKKGPITTQK